MHVARKREREKGEGGKGEQRKQKLIGHAIAAIQGRRVGVGEEGGLGGSDV